MSASSISQLRAGSLLWVASLQYYIVQLAAGAVWARSPGYSWTHNTISDLANTHCGLYGSRLVCSPWHMLMNASFIVLGFTMIVGAGLLYRSTIPRLLAKLGFVCMISSGIGSIVVGCWPENIASLPHVLGATLAFVLGNIGIILLGVSWRRLPVLLRVYSVLSGLIGLTASALVASNIYAGFGVGGMERLAAYPQSIWMIVFGCYLLISDKKQR